MRKKGWNYVIAVFVSAVAFSWTASPVFAAGVRPMTDGEALAQVPPGAVAQFREDYTRVRAVLKELILATGPGVEGQTALEMLAETSAPLSDAEIARFILYGVDYAPLRRSLDNLALAVADAAGPSVNVSPPPGDFPSANLPPPPCLPMDYDAMFAALTTLQIAKGVWSVADRGCNEVVVAVGEGGNTSLVCIAADTILFAAEAVYDQLVLCNRKTTAAKVDGNYRRLAYLSGQLIDTKTAIVNNDNANKNAIMNNDNANKTAIINNDNSNKDTIVANDNANKDTIVANDNANKDTIVANDDTNRDTILAAISALAQDLLKGRIQANLTSLGTPVAEFVLPQADGGHLGDVQAVVADAITAMTAAGQSVGWANTYKAMADGYFAGGQYKRAYLYYRYAYRQVGM